MTITTVMARGIALYSSLSRGLIDLMKFSVRDYSTLARIIPVIPIVPQQDSQREDPDLCGFFHLTDHYQEWLECVLASFILLDTG